MANVITALTKLPARIRSGNLEGNIFPVNVSVDTVGTVDLYTPETGFYGTCVGMMILESATFSGFIKSQTQVLSKIDRALTQAPIIERFGSPIFFGLKSEKIQLEIVSGALVDAMFYFMDLHQIPTEL